jgi:glutamine amidotransferase
MQAGELIHVGPGLEVASKRILDGPPAKPLTLADLTGRARASQSKTP